MDPVSTKGRCQSATRPIRLALKGVGRLVCFWLAVVVSAGVFGDPGVEAVEPGAGVKLRAPQDASTPLSRARLVTGPSGDMVQVVRTGADQAGPVTVVTGFPCTASGPVCRHLASGEYLLAAEAIRDRIARGEDGARIRCGLANALFLEGDLRGASRAYSWAATGYPDHPDVHNGLGNLLASLHQHEQAAEEFRLLAEEPGYAAVAHNNLGNAYRQTNRLDDALVAYDRAIDEDAGLAAAHYNQGATLLALGRFDPAADAFRLAANHAAGFADACLYEGLARLRAKRPSLAAVALFRAEELGANGPVLHTALGIALQEVGLNRESVRHLELARRDDPDDHEIHQLLAVSLVRLGRLERAAEVIEQGFARGPRDADAHFLVGLKLFLCERHQDAARHFLAAASMGRTRADTYFALGQALLQSGELDAAHTSLSLAVRLAPRSPEIHFTLAIARFQKGDHPGALRAIEKAAVLDPDDADTRLVQMEFQQHTGDFRGCARTGRVLVDRHPELVAPRFDTALCFAMDGRLDLAREALEDALDHDTEGDEVLGLWRRLEALIEAHDRTPGIHLLHALIHERRGNWDRAVRSYERFILFSPSKDWTRKALERIHHLAPRTEPDPDVSGAP